MNSYSQYRPMMATGDIMLFSGKGLISKIIQIGSGSPWSHVGMVIEVPGLDTLCLFESTTLSDIPCIDQGAPVKGVQLVPLSQRVAMYDGQIAWRKALAPVTPATMKAALDVRKEFSGVPYEENQLELISSALDATGLLTNQPDMSSVFCSELVAIAYMRMGWMFAEQSPNEYTPGDFAGGSLPLAPAVELAQGVMIKDDDPLTEELDDEEPSD